tara:strand:+ start:2282 stop:3061 length:780 start_codon:yes stop_codon:yes gene_type:complete
MAGLMTGLAIAGATAQLAGAGMSFADARKQKKAQAQAEREAEMAMTAARKSLELNYMDALSIQKEPYELERDASLVAGAQATEVLRESERGAGRIGSIYGQQQLAQRQISSAMGQEMFNLDYLSAQEDTRLRDIGTQIDLGEVTGAQLAAANSEERRAQQLQAGVQGIGNAAMTGVEGLALYRKTKDPKIAPKYSVRGPEITGLDPSAEQSARWNVSQTPPPQLPETPLEKIMRMQQADQSLNTPIGAPPTNFMLPLFN